MKKEEKFTITIDSDKSRNDIIYENTVNHLHLTMDEQVKFLKRKVFYLEEELHERTGYIFLFLFTFISLVFGIILLCFDFYILGIALIISTFIFVIIKLLLNFHNKARGLQSNEFDKVEEMISLLNKKLK